MIHLRILFILLSSCMLCSSLAIDYWEDCDVDKKCYVKEACIETRNDNNVKLTEFKSNLKLKNKDCEILMTVKPYTEKKYLIIIRVFGLPMQSKNLTLSQGDKTIVNCEETDEVIKVAVEDPQLKALNPTLYEELSHFDSTEAVCAFTITNPKEKLSSFHLGLATTIVYDQTKFEYEKSGIEMFAVFFTHVKCDPDLIQPSDGSSGFEILPVKNKARLKIDCSNYNSNPDVKYEYGLFIDQPENSINNQPTSKLECDTSRNEYTFNNGTHDVFLSDAFAAYCGVALSKTCKMPDLKCKDTCPLTPKPARNEDVKLECADGKWLIEGEYYEGINPVCKGNEDNRAVFYMEYKDGSEKELTEGSCFKEYDCNVESNLAISECEEGSEDCGEVEEKDGILRCARSEFTLTIYSDGNVRNDTKEFKCNPQNGSYERKNESVSYPSVTIKRNSRVVCRKEREKAKEEMSAAQLALICVSAAVGATLFAVACVFAILCVYNMRNRLRGTIVKKKEKWKRMPLSEQIAEAQKTFGKAGLSQGEEPTLLDALKLLDAVLESETEDPDLWDSIKLFLRRFQAVAHSKDYGIERIFNRYCYLQAKKIIDKHGWISQTRITKSNPSGFIRVGAIQLLAIARLDVVEAQEMILDGFKKLRFDAVEQYPHCGLLWSLLTQQRVGSVVQTIKLTKRLTTIIDPSVFHTKKGIRQVVEADRKKEENKQFEIPEADRFVQFGSVRQQCCYAIAASDVCDNGWEAAQILKEVKDEEWASLSKSILEGVLDCTSGNTMLMKAFGLRGAGKEIDLIATEDALRNQKIFRNLIPTVVELEQVMTKLAFHRRMRDARTFEKRFDVLNVVEKESQEVKSQLGEEGKEKVHKALNPPCKLYPKVKECHRVFVEALIDEKKDIENWLSNRMGKNEVKKAEKSQPKSEIVPPQGKEGREVREDVDDPLEVDEFVASFYKESTVERITKCPLDENEQSKLRSILKRILDKDTVLGVRVQFTTVEVVEICNRVTEITMREPMLIEDVPAGISVITDLHGQLYDLARIFDSHAKEDKQGYECEKYLFTGDYVDRGSMSLELLMTVFILKILYPDRFWILRGNHEYTDQNCKYGFMEEIEERFDGSVAESLFYKLNETFVFLSQAAIVGGQILCVHGGISAGPFTRHELRLIRKPVVFSPDDLLVNDMAWADPAKGMEGYFYNHHRGASIFFGDDVLQNALDRIECTALIRGHTMLTKGYAKLSHNCLPLFSATAVDVKLNNGAFVRISEDLRWQVVVLKYDTQREAADREFYGEKKEDEPTVCDEDLGDGEIMQDEKE